MLEYAGKAALQQTKDSAQEKIDKAVIVIADAMEEMNANMEGIDKKVSSPLSYNAETEALTLFGSIMTASEEE